MPTRSEYVTMVWIYKKRREEARSKKVLGATKYLTRKINQWIKVIRRIDKRNETLGDIAKQVDAFFGVSIKSKCMNVSHKLARKVYYKYSIEKGIQGAKVSRAIGRVDPFSAIKSRRLFTKSFIVSDYNKDQYHNFLNYMKNI